MGSLTRRSARDLHRISITIFIMVISYCAALAASQDSRTTTNKRVMLRKAPEIGEGGMRSARSWSGNLWTIEKEKTSKKPTPTRGEKKIATVRAFSEDGSTKILRSGSAITVEWSGINDVQGYDWIGLYYKTDKGDFMVDYIFAATGGDSWRSGSGKVVFHNVLNVRLPLFFRYYHWVGIEGKPVYPVAHSNLVSFKHVDAEPLQIHIELGDSASSIRVKFVTNISNGTPIVRYGESPDALVRSATGTSTTYTADMMCGYPANSTAPGLFINPGMFHTVDIHGLKPRRAYFYQVGTLAKGEMIDTVIWSDVIEFVSPYSSDYDGKISFIVLADQGTIDGGVETSAALTKRLVTHLDKQNDPPAFILHLGDIAYAIGAGYTWDKWGAQISPYASRYPYMASVGNHEYDHMSGADKDPSGVGLGFHPSWGDYGDDSNGECGIPFSHRYSAPSTGNGVWWYSFDYGPVHVLQMSTEHDFTRGSEQYRWIQQDLQRVNRTKTPWVIFTGHRPMYHSEADAGGWSVSLGLQRELEDVLIHHQVDVAMWGHYHSYQRSCRVNRWKCVDDSEPGVMHITTGMAGFILDKAPYQEVEWAQVSDQKTYGYSLLEVDRNTLELRVIAVPSGKMLDQVVLRKPVRG